MPPPVNGPAALLAALPAHLGRYLNPPEVVLLGWADGEPDYAVTVSTRCDAESDPRTEADLARQAVIDGAEQVALVVAVSEWRAQWAPTPDLVARYVAASCARYGLDLLDAVVIIGDRWRSLACTDPTCCPPDGRPLPTPLTHPEGTPTP